MKFVFSESFEDDELFNCAAVLLKQIRKLFILFILVNIAMYFYIKNSSLFEKKSEVEETPVIEEKIPEKEEYNLSLIMVGDALIHSNLYIDAKQADGTYDFKPMLELTKPITSRYDLAYYNQETILGGTSLGLSSYPRFNSPTEVGDAFLDSGFNMVSLATNHTMDKNEVGVLKSLEYWNSKTNVVTAGSYSSFEDRNKERIYEKNGIKYAFFSYTTWTNGLETPRGKEYLNNVYSNEKATEDISKVRDKVDVVIVAMHWGNEYSLGVSTSQTEIATHLSSLGVDIIIGSHPHVVEPVEFIGKTLVIYSLGNYISDQIGIERLTGLMMAVDIKKVVDQGITTISLENLRAELLYTKSKYGRDFKVYPYSSLNNVILPNYMSYYEKYKNVVTSRYKSIEFGLLGELR